MKTGKVLRLNTTEYMTPFETLLFALSGNKLTPQHEAIIAENPYHAYDYAAYVINGRFIQGEPAISAHPHLAYRYSQNILNARWPQAEQCIGAYPKYAYLYAAGVLKGRFCLAEKTLINDDSEPNSFTKPYLYVVIKQHHANYHMHHR